MSGVGLTCFLKIQTSDHLNRRLDRLDRPAFGTTVADGPSLQHFATGLLAVGSVHTCYITVFYDTVPEVCKSFYEELTAARVSTLNQLDPSPNATTGLPAAPFETYIKVPVSTAGNDATV